MKRMLSLLPLLSSTACAAAQTDGGTLRAAILIALGVASVILLILFGKPNAKNKNKE